MEENQAHYNAAGKVCYCPWGVQDESLERYGSKREWLQNRPDFRDNPRNQQFLKYVDRLAEMSNGDFDKLLPWIHREFKRGRLAPGIMHNLDLGFVYRNDGSPWEDDLESGEPGTLPWVPTQRHPKHTYLSAERLPQIQNLLEEMGRRKQGVDVMQHQVHHLIPKVEDFETWKLGQDRDQNLGQIVHEFPDGWSIRRLHHPGEFADEGEHLGHCIGDPQWHDYSEAGDRMYFSLRDHRNLPHATIEMIPNHWVGNEATEYYRPGPRIEGWEPELGANAKVEQFFGKGNRAPIPAYQERVDQWLGNYDNANARSVFATADRPLYYRWVYSPQRGVTLNSNQDDHPALVKYHQQLGGDINDMNLSHGFASAIGGGWRITDLEHQPVEDPYIVQQVVRRLNMENGPEIRSEGSWQPSEYDWDRLHYGLPCEKVGNSSD